jgi:hypothetical protein
VNPVTENQPRSPDTRPSSHRQRPNRFWPAAAVYVLAALAGSYLGREFYLRTPLSITDSLIFSDLRHGGAIAGAVVGAMLAAITRHQLSRFAFSGLAPIPFLIGLGLLAYLLCHETMVLGIATLVILALPWTMALRS